MEFQLLSLFIVRLSMPKPDLERRAEDLILTISGRLRKGDTMKRPTGEPDISIMTRADIDFATQMTDTERWGYSHGDFENLIAFQPGGCFVARDGGRPVGIITSTSYNAYAFVGTLIVRQSHRNRRIGEGLLRHAMKYLRSKGVRTIELDGVFQAVSLYRRLGFKDKYLSLRFLRPPAKASASGKPPIPEPAEEIVEFDFRMTGIKRERILHRYLQEHSDACYVIRNGALSAYAFVRPRSDGSMAVGPLVSVDDRAAERLMTGIVTTHGEVGLSVGVPQARRSMVELLPDLGFNYHAPSLRMYLGDRLAYEAHIYGILSPEKG